MKYFCTCTVLLLSFIRLHSAATGDNFHVAIVGGGIGGASAAYWLRKLENEKKTSKTIKLTLFEPNGRIGGRIRSVQIAGKQFEAGASVLHPANLYMVNWRDEFGLQKQDSPDGGRMGLWDGEEFVFEESDWKIVTFFKMFWRYGMDLLRLKHFIQEMLANFANIYKALGNYAGFETADDLLYAMYPSFSSMLNVSLKDHLLQTGFSQRFISELTAAAENTNYGQSVSDLQAFVGSVGLAGAVPNLWAVKGGNEQIPQRLVQYSQAEVIRARVARISRAGSSKFIVTAVESNNNEMVTSDVDAVVVAAPLIDGNLDDLHIDGLDMNKYSGPFEPIVATFVRGSPNTKHFRKKDDDFPDAVLVTDTELFFNSLGQWVDTDWSKSGSDEIPKSGNTRIWKIFSKHTLTSAQLTELFAVAEEIKEVKWLAYPNYQGFGGNAKRRHFMLTDGIYHTNAIEWAASAMEMSAIAGRNVANLILHRYLDINGGKTDDIEGTALKSEL